VAISDEDVARVRAATDIVALIGEHAALKRQGRRWVGLCPFHQEKSPSFSVNAEEGLYYCFGCQQSGDAISFVREMEAVDFVEAVRRLADRAGITITEDPGASAEHKRRAPLYAALDAAVSWYHEQLLSSPAAGAARDYLRSRGYDGVVVRSFRLGWAPDDWDALARHLRLSDSILTDSGLGFVNRRGRQQDAFRARVIFPIFDPSGKAVALGGRILPPAPGAPLPEIPAPKYKNSQESPIYSKRRTLYGLNWAKKDVIASGEVVVCEGYTDVIGCFQVGIPRAVATCGTALAEDHFRLLRNFAKRIVLAYDADAAGQAGANRVYEWERHHEVDVAVAALPPGSDPGDLARTDPEALRRAIADAQPFLAFRVERVLQGADLSGPEGRAKAGEAALAVVAEHPSELVRDQYVMLVADRCRLDHSRLRDELERLRREGPLPVERTGRTPGQRVAGGGSLTETSGGGQVPGAGEGRSGTPPADRAVPRVVLPRRTPAGASGVSLMIGPELEALCLAIHRPEEVAHRFDAVLFGEPLHRRAFEALLEADSLHEAIDHAEPEVADLLARLAVEEPISTTDGVFVRLVREATRRALADVESQARLAEGSAGALARFGAVVATVRKDLDELDSKTEGVAAAARLLAWLSGRGEEDA
jgi:DNA primase